MSRDLVQRGQLREVVLVDLHAELVLQHVVDRADDEVDDLDRGIDDAQLVARALEEGFVALKDSKGNLRMFSSHVHEATVNNALANGDDNWDAGIFIGYQIEKWRPYVEFWNSSVSSKTDQRQLKTRVGVKYKF